MVLGTIKGLYCLKMIDTHAHLSDQAFEGRLDQVVKSAKDVGVERIIVPSVDLEDAIKVKGIAQRYQGVYAQVGVHPEKVINDPDFKLRDDEMVRLIKDGEKVVGIGEIGMDFYWDRQKKTRKRQIELFNKQLELAVAMDLPVVIHMRDAEEEVTEVIKSLDIVPRGQFHCWSGGVDFLNLVIDKGFYVSFGGNVTYKKNEHLVSLVKQTPIERLVLETDAPYLAPGELRGRMNEPKNVRIVASFLAGLYEKSIEEINEITSKNALVLFNKVN
mgnify:CR=1 FL=1